jgi:hypothetical protein
MFGSTHSVGALDIAVSRLPRAGSDSGALRLAAEAHARAGGYVRLDLVG